MKKTWEGLASEAATQLGECFDVFLVCASFEKRCLTAAKNIPRSAYVHGVPIRLKTKRAKSIPETDTLAGLLGAKELLELPTEIPYLGADILVGALVKLGVRPGNCSVLMDITTFTKEVLIWVLACIEEVFKPSRLVCVYNPAGCYNGRSVPFLSKGPYRVRSVLGFSGDLVPSRKNHLVVAFGYEIDRALDLINAFEPDILSFGIIPPNAGVSTAMHERHLKLFEEFSNILSRLNVHKFPMSAVDPFAAYESLAKHLNGMPATNVILAPLNTKLSTIGVYLYAREKPNVQVCYARPAVYNYEDYSEPSDRLIIVKLR